MAFKVKKEALSLDDKEDKNIEEKRKKEIARYIGNNIHKYRTNLNLTREQLAEKSNLTASHIYQLEIGNSVPSIVTIIDICNSLNISISQLTENLIFDDINKFIDSIAKNYAKLSDKEKRAIVHLIENLAK